MRLQKQKTELETRRAQLRAAVSANSNDASAAAALRQVEGELATVNAQLIHGPGARGVVNRDRGRAAVAARSNPKGATGLPVPAPMPTAAPTDRQRAPFISESDVPYPIHKPSQGAQIVRQNGRVQHPQPPVVVPPAVQPPPAALPVAQIETPAAAAPRSYSFSSSSDVPYPENKPSNANAIFRSNGNP